MTTNLVTEYQYKTKPFKHQLDALAQSATKKNFAYFMEMGCFNGDTEFLTTRGWVKFNEFNLLKWERPLLVAQAEPAQGYATRRGDYAANFTLRFVEPEAFIEKVTDDWYTITGTRKSSSEDGYQWSLEVTGEHTFPLLFRDTLTGMTRDFIEPVYSASDMYKLMNKETPTVATSQPVAMWYTKVYSNLNPPDKKVRRGTNMYIPAVCGKGMARSRSKYYREHPDLARLSDAELQFMVAVIADGTYPNRTNDKVDFQFTKKRKMLRIKELAQQAGIPIVCEVRDKFGRSSKQDLTPALLDTGIDDDYKSVYIIHAIAPMRCKAFDDRWYSLKPDRLKKVVMESFRWDGSVMRGISYFYSSVKSSVDFIQYGMMALGWHASTSYCAAKKAWTIKGSATDCFDRSMLLDLQEPEKFPLRWESFAGCRLINSILREKSNTKRKAKPAYCFRVPSGYLVVRSNGKIFISGNSGKTKVMLDNIGMLYEKKAITAALVLAPKGVYRNWASKEIPTHLPDTIDRDVLVWDASYSQGYKDRLVKQIREWDGKKLQFLVFNIESLISEKGKKLIVDFIKRHDGNVLALVDESTCIKNHKAKRTKAAIEIGAKCKARRIATGSPVTNSPLDLYAQCAFLDKSLLGCGSYYAFKNTYADIERVQNRMGQHYEKILRYKNLDHLSGLLDKFSFRVTKKECLDLPEKIYMTRDVELTPEQARIYTEMDRYLFSYRKEGEELKEMSASVILTKMLRLHQVLCGSFTDDEGNITRIDNKRVEALKEVLDESSGKVIIWANYLADIDAISEMLTKEYGKDSFVTYYGAVSADDRVRAIERFQDESSPVRFFLGNTQTAGRGITLTAASTVVYYSNNFSLELRQQSEDRAHRLGQRNPVTYIDLVVRGSLDEKIIKSLIEKRNIANEILKDDLESWISLTKE